MTLSSALPCLRRLCSILPGCPTRYSASEALALLEPDAEGDADRRAAVLAAAAVPSSWTGYLRDAERGELGRLTERLPTIVYWYRRGFSFEEIGRRIGPFGGPWRARRALEVAAGCIAARLNDRGVPSVRGAV